MNILIVRPPETKQWIQVFVDDELWKELSTTVFGKKFRIPPMNTSDELETWFQEQEKKKSLRYAYWLLSKRDYTEKKLLSKLKEKGIGTELSQYVVKDCIEKGFINEDNYLERTIRSLIQKGHGPRLIEQKLYLKGFSKERIAETLASGIEEEVQLASIQAFLEKKRWHPLPNDPKEKQKAIQSLMRRGFSYDLISKSQDL